MTHLTLPPTNQKAKSKGAPGLAMDARPGGPSAKREPSPEGLGIYSGYDLSAVGAARNLDPLAPVSLGGPRP